MRGKAPVYQNADPGRVAYLLRRCKRYCGDSLTAHRTFWQSPSGAALERLLKELDTLSYHIEMLFSAIDPVAEDEAYYEEIARAVAARENP